MSNKNKNNYRKCAIYGPLFAAVLIGAPAIGEEAKSPFTFDSVLTADILNNSKHGGLKAGTGVLTNLDLTAAWTGDNGFEAFGYLIVNSGGSFSGEFSGDTQGVSNIDAPPAARLLEAWVKKTSADQKYSASFGIMNLNAVFDAQPIGGVFLNSSHGMGPDYSQSGPSIFPISGLSLVGEYRPTENFSIRGAISDGVSGNPNDETSFATVKINKSEGMHYVAEIEKSFDQGFLKLGHWGFTTDTDRIDGSGIGHANGTYIQLGLNLSHEADDKEQGLKGWARAGFTDDSVSEIQTYIGGGLVYTGPIEGRDADTIGFGVSSIDFGEPFETANGFPLKSETTFELTYQAEIKPGFTIQPDIQYVANPSGFLKDAIVVGFRVKIGLEAFK